jgi:hypothetical protein
MSRLNFTGRKKILRKDVRAEVNSEDGKLELTAKLSRTGDGGYEFPGDAQIITEATIRQTFMRFELGTVADQVEIQREHLFEFDPEAARVIFEYQAVLEGCGP